MFSLNSVKGPEMVGGLGEILFGVSVNHVSILRYEYCGCTKDWSCELWSRVVESVVCVLNFVRVSAVLLVGAFRIAE
jgi:hypothetical protein